MKFKYIALCLLFLYSVGSFYGQEKPKPKKSKTGFVAIPMINYNSTQGIVAGAMVTGLYKLNKRDTISPSSSSGIIGVYTQQKSYMLLFHSQLYMAKDKWRIMAAAGKLNVNFQYYLENPLSNEGKFLDYITDANVAMLQVQRNVFKRVYVGMLGSYVKSKTTFDLPAIFERDSVKKSTLNNLGFIISNDTRDHVQYPSHGMFLNLKSQFYRSGLGSDYNFEKYNINYNQFFNLTNNEKNILVCRVNMTIAMGDVPFEGKTVVGGDDIRGYSQGKYRDNQVYTLQTEYRWNFYKRFGMVAFAGIATAVKKATDISKGEILPGGGVGLRYRMLPSEKINIGIDGALGKDDYSITFRISEAFGR